ncbi:MAG: right-handed parallel beta-helix repeat-containing protein [Pseudomonadota bacterium]|uniref:right-handed parallel beta-helix repeat-containing protein n=1 Tax=Gallaecimonas pentaromativorans TaxID=584787 RepID=UPI00067EF739|nr:right-handed parallel beta-helix repeat-containing protein [Gallaecimonas pentaromativorans]MED5523627.1 right-handed parallel beta-helix repeat-containing protein [Pseudomonadota bacterium]
MRKAVFLWASLALAAPLAQACNQNVAPGQSIQAAIDALPKDNSPQTLCLQAGTYNIDGLLHIDRSNITLSGAGDASHIQMRDDVEQPVLVIGDYQHPEPQAAIRNVVIENLKLTGNHSAKEFMPALPYLSNSVVIVRRGEQIVFRNLTLDRCRSACLLTERQSSNVRIEQNRITGAMWDGVSFNSTRFVVMRGNSVSHNVAAAITAENLEDSYISNNQLVDNGSHGAYLSNSYRNVFEDNTINNNKQAGIYLTCAIRTRSPLICWDNSMSADNTFKDNTLNDNTFGYAVGVDSAANCAKPGFKINVWKDNHSNGPNQQYPALFGRCTTADPES